jgi:tetratricopeptide (TPR) repeat protein
MASHTFLSVSTVLAIGLLGTIHALGHGAYHDQLALVTAEIAEHPAQQALYLQRAKLHVSHEDWQSALVDLEHADRLAPNSGETNGIRGQAMNLAGRWEVAELVLTSHIEGHPHDAGAHFERARARVNLQRLKSAVEDFRRALSLMPLAAPERVLEACNAIAAGEGPAAALAELSRALTVQTPDPALLQRAVDLAETAGLHDVALKHLHTLLPQSPQPEIWMAREARLLMAAKRESEAVAAWNKLLQHLDSLPNLQRGTPAMIQLLDEARQATGIASPVPVQAPPAPAVETGK